MIIRTIYGTLENKLNGKLFQPFGFDFENNKVAVKEINPTNGNVRANAKEKWYPMENMKIREIALNGTKLTTWDEVKSF